jgi:hypothetical protein
MRAGAALPLNLGPHVRSGLGLMSALADLPSQKSIFRFTLGSGYPDGQHAEDVAPHRDDRRMRRRHRDRPGAACSQRLKLTISAPTQSCSVIAVGRMRSPSPVPAVAPTIGCLRGTLSPKTHAQG